MAREAPTTAYTEVQIDEDSISLTLISESGSSGAVVEDTARFTFDELQSLSGQHLSLSLSGDSQEALSEQNRLANIGRIFEMSNQIEEGDVLVDQNPAPWSDNHRVVVDEVTDTSADEHVIEENAFGDDTTVADANPTYDADETVIIGRYEGSTKQYAFPESRLAE